MLPLMYIIVPCPYCVNAGPSPDLFISMQVSVEPEHTNPHIQELCRSGYVLKVLNSMDTPRMHVGK